ncbi:MAG: DUF1996 domain-containing protein [Acidimicrobiales bacterium]
MSWDGRTGRGGTVGAVLLTGWPWRRAVGWCLAVLSFVTAVIHFAVAGQHFQEWWLFGVLMLVAAWAQTSFAVATVIRPSRPVWFGGALLNAGIAVYYVVTRTYGDVIGPTPRGAESVGFGDLACTVLEVLVVVGCAWLLLSKGQHQVPARRSLWLPVAAATIGAIVLSAALVDGGPEMVMKVPASAPAASVHAPAMSPPDSRVAPISTKGFPRGNRGAGIFTDRCAFSHEAADDPLLYPGKPGQSMQHDFYGNTTTSAGSTAKTLTGGATTCSTAADASAYWTPVLYQDGQPLQPKYALIYWSQPGRLAPSVTTMPAGIEMIAGDESATAPQPRSVVRWTCTAVKDANAATSVPHNCAAGQMIRLIVSFPSCWDGHTLDGATQSNVVYPVKGRCPTGHPVVIPQVIFHVSYPTSSAADLTLSMSPTMQGSTDTAHVDFINGWSESLLARNVKDCIAAGVRCGPVKGPEAVPQGGVR